MFEDDPEMQKMMAKAAAEPEPEKKPLLWQVLLAVAMLLGAGIVAVIGLGAFSMIDIRTLAFGLLAGGLACEAALGWVPGRYRNIHTDEKLTLWKPLKPAIRALCGAGSVVVLGAGVGIAWYDASEAAEKAAKASPAPAQHPTPGAPKPAAPAPKAAKGK